MTCHILSPVLFFENHLKAAHFVRPLYDKLVSIGSTLLTLLPPKNAVFFPTGMHLPVGNSFDVRKVIGSSPISSTKPLVKTSGFSFVLPSFFFSSGKPLAVGQVIGPGPGSSTKPDRKVGLFLLSSGKPLAVGQVTGSGSVSSAKKKTTPTDVVFTL